MDNEWRSQPVFNAVSGKHKQASKLFSVYVITGKECSYMDTCRQYCFLFDISNETAPQLR